MAKSWTLRLSGGVPPPLHIALAIVDAALDQLNGLEISAVRTGNIR